MAAECSSKTDEPVNLGKTLAPNCQTPGYLSFSLIKFIDKFANLCNIQNLKNVKVGLPFHGRIYSQFQPEGAMA
jgi:hypothetical protein